MPLTYNPSAVALASITQPSDGDGPGIKAADVNPATAAIADGVFFERAKITPLADLTALAAIAAPSDGTPRHVLGFGWYTFKTSATTGLSPFRVAAADATPGGWVASAAHETTLVKRVPITPFAEFNSTTPFITTQFAGQGPAGAAMARYNAYCPNAVNTSTGQWHFLQRLDRDLVQGATLSSAALKFRPKTGHGALPTRQPGFAILRTALFGGYHTGSTVSLLSTTGGYAKLAAASVVAYEVDTTLVFTSDQNHTSIDLDTYAYALCIADESGTNALADSDYYQLAITLSSVPDARRGG